MNNSSNGGVCKSSHHSNIHFLASSRVLCFKLSLRMKKILSLKNYIKHTELILRIMLTGTHMQIKLFCLKYCFSKNNKYKRKLDFHEVIPQAKVVLNRFEFFVFVRKTSAQHFSSLLFSPPPHSSHYFRSYKVNTKFNQIKTNKQK